MNSKKIVDYIRSKFKFNKKIKNLDISNVDKEFIKKNKKLILNYLENIDNNDSLYINPNIVSFLREQKRYDLIKKFNLYHNIFISFINLDLSSFNDRLIIKNDLSNDELEEYKDWILEYIENNDKGLYDFLENRMIFDLAKKYKKELLYKFKLGYIFPELNNDILEEYSSEILNYLKVEILKYQDTWRCDIPENWLNSKILFNFLLEKDYLFFVDFYTKYNSKFHSILLELSADEIKEHGNQLALYFKKNVYEFAYIKKI